MNGRRRGSGLWTATVALCGLGVLAAGCGSDWQNYDESFLRSGITAPAGPEAPDWVRGDAGTIQKSPDRVYFVGRGIGYNVFDERSAYDNARDHALVQLGKQVATWISARQVEGDRRNFQPESGLLCIVGPSFPASVGGGRSDNRFLPGEKANQRVASAAAMCTQALAGDLVNEATYWEQWYIQERPERPIANSLRMKRYKCWVLMSISRDQMESRIQGTLAALRVSAARPNCVFGVVSDHASSGPPARFDPRSVEKVYEASQCRR